MREISKVPVYDRAAKEFVEADFLDGVSLQEVMDAHIAWQPAMKALLLKLERAGVPKEKWPEHRHWIWPLKAIAAQLEQQRLFGIYHDLQMQGLMIISPRAKSKLDPGEHMVYLDYVAAAPWNLDIKDIQTGRLKLIGRIFFTAAVQFSDSHGLNGRVGLYALPQAVPWYERLNMIEVPSAALENGLRYFEMNPTTAKQFLSEE